MQCYTQNLTRYQFTSHVEPWVPQYTCIPHPRELNNETLNQQTREGLTVQEHPMRVHPAKWRYTGSHLGKLNRCKPTPESELSYCELAPKASSLPRGRARRVVARPASSSPPGTHSAVLIAPTAAKQRYLSAGPRA